jgi:hypothetical protein
LHRDLLAHVRPARRVHKYTTPHGPAQQRGTRLDEGQDCGPLPGEIVALTAFESRLQATHTWPYNTDMLRTLFFSVLVPGGAMVARLVADTVLSSWGIK